MACVQQQPESEQHQQQQQKKQQQSDPIQTIAELHSEAIGAFEDGSFDVTRSVLVDILRRLRTITSLSDATTSISPKSILRSNNTNVTSVDRSTNDTNIDVHNEEDDDDDDQQNMVRRTPCQFDEAISYSNPTNPDDTYFVRCNESRVEQYGVVGYDPDELGIIFTGAMRLANDVPVTVPAVTVVVMYNLALTHHLDGLQAARVSSSVSTACMMKALQLYEKCLVVFDMMDEEIVDDETNESSLYGSCCVAFTLLKAALYHNLGQIYRDVIYRVDEATAINQDFDNIVVYMEQQYIRQGIIHITDIEFFVTAFNLSQLSKLITRTAAIGAAAA